MGKQNCLLGILENWKDGKMGKWAGEIKTTSLEKFVNLLLA
jgi:hypothetical protein